MTHVARQNVAGILLAGGKSSRMGADKAMLNFAGQPMAAWCAAALAQSAPTLYVSGENMTHARAVAQAVSHAWPRFTVLRGCQVEPVADEAPDKGPLGGMVACLARAKAPHIVVSACDTPLVPAEFYRRALSMLDQETAVAPVLDAPEPLISAWRRNEALWGARQLLERGRGPHAVLEVVGARLVDRKRLSDWGLDPAHFTSANTPESLAGLLALASAASARE